MHKMMGSPFGIPKYVFFFISNYVAWWEMPCLPGQRGLGGTGAPPGDAARLCVPERPALKSKFLGEKEDDLTCIKCDSKVACIFSTVNGQECGHVHITRMIMKFPEVMIGRVHAA